MNRPSIEKQETDYVRALYMADFALMMISCMLNSSNARAATTMPSDYRIAAAGDKFADTWQFALAFRMRPPRRLRGFLAHHFELAVGTISTSQESNPFVSLGPVWRLPFNGNSLFVELGISPTLLGGSTFNGRDMGGNFHFTSSIAVEAAFGLRRAVAVALRLQHTSNGGLSTTNPGMDMLAISFSYRPGF